MLFQPAERAFVLALGKFQFSNPMLSDRMAELRALLEIDLGLNEQAAQRPPILNPQRPELDVAVRRMEALLARLQNRLRQATEDPTVEELRWYGDIMTGALYFRFFCDSQVVDQAGDGTRRVKAFREFAQQCRLWNQVPVTLEPFFMDAAHIFAVASQLRRAFVLISTIILGNSQPIKKLRAAIWNSIFPHELRLYGTLLFQRMHDVTTLILGPSGTGKELVATAIGLSRYIPFDAQRQTFAEPLAGGIHPINLSAMPRELIESEMFGHCAGAFTGALRERKGWFEQCRFGHTVFLDEIGELDETVQVKLLRLLQSREFFRVGETDPRQFQGKIIAATNRDLAQEIRQGKFREDLFYRLCSDIIRTPSLRSQLDDAPDDLPHLVRWVATRCLGEQAQPNHVDWLSDLSIRWINHSGHLGPTYAWPGNFRELEQCVRNIMVRGEYHPPLSFASPLASPPVAPSHTALETFLSQVRSGSLNYDELLNFYCSFIFSLSPHLTAAASRLGKHRSTVKQHIVPEYVERLKSK